MTTSRTTPYAQRYESLLGEAPGQSAGWMRFPFEWGTPEAMEVQAAIWSVEAKLWGRFITTLAEEGVPGDLVEFGVSAGNSLDQLASFREQAELDMEVWGFDSFEGLPELSEHDPTHWQAGEFAADMGDVARRLRVSERPWIHLVKGWFCDTLKREDILENILEVAFARIDCDLYESTVDCLNFLEDRLSDRAILCFDDWTDDPETGETRAFFEFAERTKGKLSFEPMCRISLGGMHFRVSRHDNWLLRPPAPLRA